MLCDVVNKFVVFLENEEIRIFGVYIEISEKLVQPKLILNIKDASNELKYHQKINPVSHH
jgi:hypothetical protein